MTARVAQDDLIIARATAPGAAALAVLRLDGAGSAALVERLFQPARGGQSPVACPRRMVLGRWLDPASGEALDEGLTVFFKAPGSYTGNDLAEFQCHGGPVPARRLIEAALTLGARLAEPGEFTRRAFLAGKLDLAQAEAVADLIGAQTDAAARLARAQLGGELSRRIHAVRDALLTLGAEIEAYLDFPDEELEPEDRGRLAGQFDEAGATIARLLATRRRGRLLREGARVALVGRPNAGKSSLLNALARAERAIVTPHPGTTRDTVECTIDLAGVPLTLVDTAGLRPSDDPIERLGIERAQREIETADLVVLVCDATADQSGPDFSGLPFHETAVFYETAAPARRPDLVVLNKIDLVPDAAIPDAHMPGAPVPPALADWPVLRLSATRGDGLAELETALAERLGAGNDTNGAASPVGGPATAEGEASLAVNLRQGEQLARAGAALAAARAGFVQGLSGEFVMVDLRDALDALGEIVGLETGEAILDRLFGRFCIGK